MKEAQSSVNERNRLGSRESPMHEFAKLSEQALH